MLELSLLSSGSRANSIYVASATTKILLDCGLSARETEKRLVSLGRGLSQLDAIVITHEHSDHLRGLSGLVKRRKIPVWMNAGTQEGAGETLKEIDCGLVHEFSSSEVFSIGDLTLQPFRVSHDAQDPVMFRVASDSGSVAVVTDLGQVTTTVQASIRDVDALVLETNHDVEMLFQGPYPWHLKQRIRGKKGHLSNEEAAELLCDLVRFQHEQADIRRLQLIVGAHVSEKNNTSDHSLQALQNAWARCSADYNPEFLVADAFRPTPLYLLSRDKERLLWTVAANA